MGQQTNRYSTVMVIAQDGPKDAKPFFGFIPSIVTTWAEYEARLHHAVAREVMVEEGCGPELIVVCDIDDWPDFIGVGALSLARAGKAPSFEAKPHHYEQARAKVRN